MKSLTTFMLLLMPLLSQAQQHSFFKEEFPGVWQRAGEYTIEVAQAMPADKYQFKPVDEEMTFGEQMVHTVNNMAYLTQKIYETKQPPFEELDASKMDKDQIIDALNKAFDFVAKNIDSFPEDKLSEEIEFAGMSMSKERMFYLIRNHVTHHRGQAIVYLRLSGIKPPPYRGW